MNKLILSLAMCCLSYAATAAEPLHWAGCGITKKAFMAELAKRYEQVSGTPIVLEGGGAAKGIRKVANKTVALGGTCRPKLPNHAEESAARLNPVAWDALSVIVHKNNPVSDLSLEQLRQLYRGEITNWAELGGPNQPVHLLIRKGRYSGVGRILRELVFADYEAEFVSNHVFPSSGPLEKAIEADPWAIGVTGISSARKRDVKLLSLNGRLPSYDNIRDGNYLLYRPLYITYSPAHPRYREVRRFLDFAHSRQGRDIIRRSGAVPYLDAIGLIRKQKEQWGAVRG